MLFNACVLLLAASRVASAAAVNNNRTLAPGLWLNGKSIDRSLSLAAANGQPCDPNDDAVQCAAKIAQSFNVPASSQGTPGSTKIPVSLATFIPGYINVDTYVVASECTLSDPTIVSKGTLFFCNSETCSQKFTFTTSSTDTHTYGYKVSFSVTASGSILFATVSATAGAEWSENWSSSKTTTSTTERDYNMVNGQTCAPTTVQFSVTCKNTLKLADPSVQEWAWVPPPGVSVTNPIMLSCQNPPPFENAPGSNLTDFNAFCDSIQNGTPIQSTMDIAQPGVDGQPWTLEGCMYN